MHGLIFKIKESHRQDQSESFVMIEQYMFRCIVFHNKSNEITSLWPVLSCRCIYIRVCVCVHTHTHSLFHRDETKPTHIIGINSFLFLMQLRYKHSSPNYQHMISYWQLINKLLVLIDVCVRKLKHFQPHSLLCQSWCESFHASCSLEMWFHIWWCVGSWRSSFDKLLFFITYNFFHTAKQL